MRYLTLITLAISVPFTANSQTSSIGLAILGTANTVINQIGNSNVNSSVFLTNQTTENELQFNQIGNNNGINLDIATIPGNQLDAFMISPDNDEIFQHLGFTVGQSAIALGQFGDDNLLNGVIEDVYLLSVIQDGNGNIGDISLRGENSAHALEQFGLNNTSNFESGDIGIDSFSIVTQNGDNNISSVVAHGNAYQIVIKQDNDNNNSNFELNNETDRDGINSQQLGGPLSYTLTQVGDTNANVKLRNSGTAFAEFNLRQEAGTTANIDLHCVNGGCRGTFLIRFLPDTPPDNSSGLELVD
ncbi:MAG: hypothetical protein P8Q48_03480 [Paracoccaceae bacterium]|nr:hypothetical protein [Paracoccaceae bacterium]MDG1369298.1 hypothetical protein [Paracoccaceae bacterium]